MRGLLIGILVLAGVAFLLYAFAVYYKAQPTDQSQARRALGAVLAAAAAIGTAIISWFQTPPPG